MENEKNRLLYFIGKQKDCEFSLRFFLQRETDMLKNIFTMLKLVKKGTRKERKYDYGEYVLGEKLLSIQEGEKAISSIYGNDDGKGIQGKLAIPDYNDFLIKGRQEAYFTYSNRRYGYIQEKWPMRVYKFGIEQSNVQPRGELLQKGAPYYPDINNAIIHFFEIAVEQFNPRGEAWIVILDYRARIKSLKLIFSKVELELDSPEIEFEDLVLKYFATSDLKGVASPDIYPSSKSFKIGLDFQPDTLSFVLLSRQDNYKIDGKEFYKWRGEGEGIIIERPKEEILSLARAGESQNLEYKYDVIEEKNKTDFIETVVAFLNSNKGTILVGVKDNGEISGSQKDPEDLHKIIHDGCDPPPKGIKIKEQKIEEFKKVIIVEVPKGEDPPYQSKKDEIFYVRHNGSDMRVKRSELLDLLKKTEYPEM
jgi:hypothetical protein